jgi:hypothetical protein
MDIIISTVHGTVDSLQPLEEGDVIHDRVTDHVVAVLQEDEKLPPLEYDPLLESPVRSEPGLSFGHWNVEVGDEVYEGDIIAIAYGQDNMEHDILAPIQHGKVKALQNLVAWEKIDNLIEDRVVAVLVDLAGTRTTTTSTRTTTTSVTTTSVTVTFTGSTSKTATTTATKTTTTTVTATKTTTTANNTIESSAALSDANHVSPGEKDGDAGSGAGSGPGVPVALWFLQWFCLIGSCGSGGFLIFSRKDRKRGVYVPLSQRPPQVRQVA